MRRRWTAAMVLSAAAAGSPAAALELTSLDIVHGAPLALAQIYSGCGGGNVSPALSWRGAPEGTQSFAVTLFDPDAAGGWWHWIVYDIAPRVHGLPRGAGDAAPGSHMGVNDFGAASYGGACPPPGSGVHHYRFTVWALDVAKLPVEGTVTGTSIEPYLEAHALARATITATYER